MTRHVTAWPEDRVLDYFWSVMRDDPDRLALLKQIADVVIDRPSDWDTRAIRTEARFTLHADQCFVCLNGEHTLYWHHIIQVQHGGSNQPSNLVSVCHRCHGLIHPWLPASTTIENKYGWTRIGDLGARVLARIERIWTRKSA